MHSMVVCALMILALPLFGQQAFLEAPRFPQSRYFEQVLNPRIPRVELRDPVRLQDFVVNGKLELSLRNYIELVLANNTDIEIQRIAVEIPKNQILRAGAIFDPLFQGRFAATRSNSPTIDVLAGAATLSQLNQPWSFNYIQTLSTGTQVQFGFNGAKLSTNNQFQTFNPSYTANMAFGFTQPLLRGRGSYITKLPLSIARSRLKQTQYNVQDQIIRLLVQAETIYWNVIEARENLRVQEQALALNDAALKRAQRELELGATSPLEIFQPQAQYANAEIFVTQARYRLAQVEDALRRQIGADLDPEIRKLPIVLTEPVTVPINGEELDKEALVQKALTLRPDLKAAMQALDIDELNLRAARNNLLPQLTLGGGYTATGRGGVFFPRTNFGGVQQVLAPIPGGLGDAFSQVFNFGFPIYNFSLTLNLPLRDRRAAADFADANIQRKRDLLQLRTTEQQIRLEVLNAINQVELSKASVKLAQIARDLAQKRVEAEQKKYELGTTVIFFVLAAQSDLTAAEAALVTQTVGYRRNLLNLLQRTGELLQERGVILP
ncbi:MAG: TolC family protein [Bryobacteraceae bacterium]|nr:TolC family protein [Bryobacteraceae bacterium]MDW8380396.1 TolC family protein [Bryobacterales bacterium]